MLIEKKQSSIGNKYNLFSPNQLIDPCRPSSISKKSKVQIKLIFHHPNLLFLNSKKVRSTEETTKEVGQNLIRTLKTRSKHLQKSTANIRPYTSYMAQKQRQNETRSSVVNTPKGKRRHTQDVIQICGKSSCLTNQMIRNPDSSTSNFKSNSRENLFQQNNYKNQILSRQMKVSKGSKLWANRSNLKSFRLDMCFSVQKAYLKYVSRAYR